MFLGDVSHAEKSHAVEVVRSQMALAPETRIAHNETIPKDGSQHLVP